MSLPPVASAVPMAPTDVESLLKEANDKLQQLKAAYSTPQQQQQQNVDFPKCKALLKRLKQLFCLFPSFAPNAPPNLPSRAKEVVLARNALELAVLLSSKEEDYGQAFEHNMLHLKFLYDEFGDVDGSERRWLVEGLNLLRLLSQHRTAEFHMQLERIPIEQHDNMYIRDVIQLERYLMEGSYHKLLQARNKVPSREYVALLTMMLQTVRLEIADCGVKAYRQLSVSEARKLLMFESESETLQWISQHTTWPKVTPAGKKGSSCYVFEGASSTTSTSTSTTSAAMEVDTTATTTTSTPSGGIPFHAVIANSLGFASEMDRIV